MVEISKNSKQEKDQDKNTEEEISQESGKEQDLNTETQDLKDSNIENENIDQSVKNDDLNKKLEDFESEIISLKEEKLRTSADNLFSAVSPQPHLLDVTSLLTNFSNTCPFGQQKS